MTHAENRTRWAAVDWSQPDKALARQIGVSLSAVQQQRAKVFGPLPSRRATPTFTAFVTAHRDELHGVIVAEAIRRSGVKIGESTAAKILRDANVRKYTNPKGTASVPSRFPDVNWELPSPILAAVWQLNYQVVRNERSRRKAPAARWNVQSKGGMTAPAYLAAVEQERARAADHR